ncbi:hypothetical protein ACS0TY_023896 [Phlomoides rotata]
MKRVTNFIITKVDDNSPQCTRYHTDVSTGILFSAGGLARNHFHAMADVIVPLFLTSHSFNRSTIFLVSNYNLEWISKYRLVMEKESKYDIYDIDKENEVLCFSRLIIGLKAHKDLEIVPSESRRNFTSLLQLDILPHLIKPLAHQPRMLIISRNESRKLMNELQVGEMARSLGYDVVVKQFTSNLSLNAKVANSFDVMVGVHGAGLSHLVFLRENAVLIQIVPFGLDYLARVCFEGAVESNKLKYLRYNATLNESSLLGKYPPNSKIYRNPRAVSNNFQLFSKVYLDNQDVNLDLNRFRETLLRALELLST